MKHSVLAISMTSCALLLVACATEPAAPSSEAKAIEAKTAPSAGSDELICSREYPTGSNIPISKCRTRAQIEADKAVASESLRRTQTGGPNAKLGGGN